MIMRKGSIFFVERIHVLNICVYLKGTTKIGEMFHSTWELVCWTFAEPTTFLHIVKKQAVEIFGGRFLDICCHVFHVFSLL